MKRDLESVQLKKMLLEHPQEGLEQAMALYARQVKTICGNILEGFPKEDVEESVAQSFLALWKNAEKFRPERGVSIKSYLYGIARKTALMQRRSALRRELPAPEESLFAETVSPEEWFLTREAERELHRALEEMEEPARSVFIMKYFYFEKTAVIAEKLGISCKKAENILLREKKKLRKILEERGVER